MDIKYFLTSLDLEKYIEVFEEEEILLEDLISFSEDDLADLGVKLGPRKRILKALANNDYQGVKGGDPNPLTIVSAELDKGRFFSLLCDNNQLWYKPAFQNSTSIIAHEYNRLHKLLKEEQSYGAMLQIKDLMEVVLKLPVLVGVSHIYHLKERSDAEVKVLIAILEKPLSLGDWEKIAGILVKLSSTNLTLKKLLKRTLKLYRDELIVKWRNEQLGHGALAFDMDEDFRKDLISKLEAVRNYFEDTDEVTQQIRLYLIQNGKEHRLTGEEAISYIEQDTSDIAVSINDGPATPLFPFVLSSDNSIYFFDTYYSRKDKTMVLDYTKGKKKIHYTANELLKGTRRELDFGIPKRSTVDERTYSMIESEMLNKIGEVKDFQSPVYLINDLHEAMNKHNNGLFLIQMERGTGKTTFSRALDELSLNKYNKLLNCSVRAYYINDSFSYRTTYFLQQVHDSLRQDKDGKNAIVGIEGVPSDSKEKKVQFARMLNQFSEEHRVHFGKDKLLLVIDGIDEIPGQEKESILDFIPDASMLNDGVYILLTSRLEEELTAFTHFQMEQFVFTERFMFRRDFEHNRKVLISYLKKELLDNSRMTQDHQNMFDEMILKAENRFLYLKAIKELYCAYQGELVVKDLPAGAELFDFYLDKLHTMYGDKFYGNLVRILAIVARAFEGLTFREISYLSGEDKPTFTFLAYLLDLRIFFKIDRSYRGNLITISHDVWKKLIFAKYKTALDQQSRGWLEDVLYLKENRQKIDWESEGNDGEVYLITNALNYLELLNDEDMKEQFYNQSFVEFSHEVAQHLKDHTVVEYQRLRRIQLIDQQITILEKIEIEETKIAESYLMRGETYYSLMKYREAFQDYHKAIGSQETLLNKGLLANLESLLLSYAKRGAAYRRTGYFKEAVEDLTKSIDLGQNLLSKGEPVNLASLADTFNERGFTNRMMGRLQEALGDIDAAYQHLQNLEKEGRIYQPKMLMNLLIRGNIYYHMGKSEAAIENFEKAATLSRQLSEDGTLTDVSQLASSLTNLGKAYIRNNQYDKGLQYCTEAVNLCRKLDQRGQLPNRDYLSSALQYRGEARFASGDINGGLEDLDEAINKRKKLHKDGILPKFHTLIESLYARMMVHLSAGNKSAALQDGKEIMGYVEHLRQTGKWVDERLVTHIKSEMEQIKKDDGI